MSITNTSKPTTSLSNTAKVVGYETWDTIITTWASEVRTWDEMVSNWDGFAKPSTSITNTAKPV